MNISIKLLLHYKIDRQIAFGDSLMNDQSIIPKFQHSELSSIILKSCFEVMNELGVGFLESVYKNALVFSLKEKKLYIDIEKSYDVYYKKQKVGIYKADIVVENRIVVELKCCKILLPEHQAQLINYLCASNLAVGLLVNFHNKQLDYKRMYHPRYVAETDESPSIYYT